MTEGEAKMQIALAYVMNSKMPMKGILMLRDMLEKDPENTEIRERFAQFSMQTGQYEKAIEHYQVLAEQYTDNRRVHALVNLLDAAMSMESRNVEIIGRCLLELKEARAEVDDPMLQKEIDTRLSKFENILEN